MNRLRYLFGHWKIGVHLVFRTKRFGVNNQWWFRCDAVMGVPIWQIIWDTIRIYPLIRNYQLMKGRAIELGFLSIGECMLLWPRDTVEHWGQEAVDDFIRQEKEWGQ